MEKERFSKMLEAFGHLTGIDGVGLNENDACTISFDEHIILNLQFVEDDETLLIFSSLGKIEKDRQLELFSQMLEAGFYERARGGPSLGFDRATQTAMLIQQSGTKQLDFPAFESMLEHYVNCADAWIKRIDGLSDEPVKPDHEMDRFLPFDMKA